MAPCLRCINWGNSNWVKLAGALKIKRHGFGPGFFGASNVYRLALPGVVDQDINVA
jgi:hypothetical protein